MYSTGVFVCVCVCVCIYSGCAIVLSIALCAYMQLSFASPLKTAEIFFVCTYLYLYFLGIFFLLKFDMFTS